MIMDYQGCQNVYHFCVRGAESLIIRCSFLSVVTLTIPFCTCFSTLETYIIQKVVLFCEVIHVRVIQVPWFSKNPVHLIVYGEKTPKLKIFIAFGFESRPFQYCCKLKEILGLRTRPSGQRPGWHLSKREGQPMLVEDTAQHRMPLLLKNRS